MNYSKIAKVLFIIGFFILVGAVGKADYMFELGKYYPISKTIKMCLVGLILMTFNVIKIKKYLKQENIWFVKYWGGSIFTKDGIPDILICANGYFVGIELKAENGQASKLQLYNLNKIKENGGIGLLLYPKDFNLFKRLLEYLKQYKYSEAIELAEKINERR